jgi:hypothetical protein
VPDTADDRLRRRGFRIVARPGAGEPVWSRDGRRYTQSEAERLAARELKEVEVSAAVAAGGIRVDRRGR